MTYLTPNKIAEITGGEYIGKENALNDRIQGAVRDNRDVAPGNIFVCVNGAHFDGHTFANKAFESGAVCCLAEHPIPGPKGPYILVDSTQESIKKLGGYYRSLFDIPVIGITGSVGKTTTKEMTASVLGTRFNVLKTSGNMNNELGVPLTLLSLDESYDAAVIEMGISDFGEMSRLAEMVRPDICVTTIIGYSHLETLSDLQGVLRAKSEVFSYMNQNGVAVLNGDDDLLQGFDPGIQKITFGFADHNDFHTENVVASDINEVKFNITSDTGSFSVCIPSYGRHLASAALAAAAVGRLLGVTDDEIAQGLSLYAPVGGRANVTDTGYVTLINDCYNANPNSVMEALSSLSSLSLRRVAILGDMLELGSQSDQLHRKIGFFAANSAIDRLICCGDRAALIYECYMSANNRNPTYYYPTKTDLIAEMPKLIKKGDAVLVKASHGMKFEELISVICRLRE